MSAADHSFFSKQKLQEALESDTKRLKEYLSWLESHMSESFFKEITHQQLWLITQNLMGLDTHDFFCQINLKHCAIVLCLDSESADLRILEKYQMRGIKNYRVFTSDTPPPFERAEHNLRIAILTFTSYKEEEKDLNEILPRALQQEALQAAKKKNPHITEEGFYKLLENLGSKFLRSIDPERLSTASHLYYLALESDDCQYEVKKNENWKKSKETPSLQIVLAWKNVPKHNFLYRLAKMLKYRNLSMKKVSAAYLKTEAQDTILLLCIGINGALDNQAAWETTDLEDFIHELSSLKVFDEMEKIEKEFVATGLISGNSANLLKSICYFVHQMLLQKDLNLYRLSSVEEGLCRHAELTKKILLAFEAKFHPEKKDLKAFTALQEEFYSAAAKLDTGNEMADHSRKNILLQAMHFVEFTLKTNFYTPHKSAFSFRLDPLLLDTLPFEKRERFPALPFGIFFMKGMHFMGFHLRFKDLARGGLRTVIPSSFEQMILERNNVFSECYGLSYTQQKKNKDIPEGGAKGIIFLEPYETLKCEEEIYRTDLKELNLSDAEIDEKLQAFHQEQKLSYLFQTQRAYIESLMTLINCEEDGTLKEKTVVDYWKKPEYIYLGPDENMRNEMIVWIANFAQKVNYKPKGCFISSKPGAGINHKEYGVTSFGVNEYMEQVLHFMGIDPKKETFTVKMSGGPDGDVAGNQILNLYRFYPKTAKLLALTDGSGTIFDPQGLHLETLAKLFLEAKPIRYYPPELLNEGGFLLDLKTNREQSSYAKSTLLWKKEKGKVQEEWLLGNDTNHLFRHNVHSVIADIFIPAGGRPKTLGDTNFSDFLQSNGAPTAKAIVEGANLYLTPFARKSLETLGVLIIKDSSANKGGVICSSFEVLSGLILSEEEFLTHKQAIMAEVLEIIRDRARDEAKLLLRTFQQKKMLMTELSDQISQKINDYKYQILDALIPMTLSLDPHHPLNVCLLRYCPKLIRERYATRVIQKIPDVHKKAIIACFLASRVIYKKGLFWTPGIAEIMPLLLQDPEIMGD